MTLTSPLDDFVRNTLAAIPGILGKLDYVAGLRENCGGYLHWGLARVYGEESAQQAAVEAHRQVFSEILRTPINALLEDAFKCASGRESEAATSLETLFRRAPALMPPGVPSAPALHFSSVLHALSALARTRQLASQPNAWQLPQLAQ
jgi:hypothetical protein